MQTRNGFIAMTGSATIAAVANPAPAAGAQATISLQGFVQRVNTRARHKQVFGSPRIQDGTLLHYINNSLNGFQKGWGVPSSDYAAVAVFFGSPCMMALNDATWKEYNLRSLIAGYSDDYLTKKGDGNPFTEELIDLRGRGTQFYVCDNALREAAHRAAAQLGQNGDATHARFRDSMLPHVAGIVPAGVSAVALLQELGYTYFFGGT